MTYAPFPTTSKESSLLDAPRITAESVTVRYGTFEALHGITLDIYDRAVTAFIGPSGCGKSTFLRCLNRMNDLIDGAQVTGTILFDSENIHAPTVDPAELRRRVGMVFQKPNPFPMSIFDNVAYGPRLHERLSKQALSERVESSLKAAALWDEVKDKLKQSALALSGGQQQRLCIARTLATGPDVLLMDEPCSALDPISTERIEALILELKQRLAIVIVTHNLGQARRVSDTTGFFYKGDLIEFDATTRIFEAPQQKQTADYVQGRFG
jgi:phosphate transport system ATP-binding protein